MTALAARVAAETPAGHPAVPRLELSEWSDRFGITAGLTTRGEGYSLGLWSEESVGTVMTRWRAFLHSMQERFPTVVLGHQVHGTRVRWEDGSGGSGWILVDGVDGHATDQPGVLLTVTVADCIPVYLVAPTAGAIALLHAGWRGLAAGVLERGLDCLREHAGVSPGDIVMHCGVGVCGGCYEVGPEVLKALSKPEPPTPVKLDLRAILAERAGRLGIREVSVSPYCTSCDRQRFFSHRGSGGRDGRMVAYLGRPAA